MTRHMLGLFNTQPGGRAWRRTLSEQSVRAGAGVDVVRQALAHVAEHAQAAA
jgi:tRNA-dihydrouridine synthase A